MTLQSGADLLSNDVAGTSFRQGVTIHRLTKDFAIPNEAPAVDELDFAVTEGDFAVLLGESGSGKTTVLRCVAGLEVPTSGRIDLGDRTVFDSEKGISVKPHRRNVSLVFQGFALWPHMTAARNIAYPLKARGFERSKIVDRVNEVADVVKCRSFLDKYPQQLSGGQQQRVALARALAPEPRLLLFDEPLSNLDADLREQLRIELRALHQRVKFTAIYVTHDQAEALHLGDRIGVMSEGRFVQVGSPRELFESPSTPSLAKFLGARNQTVATVVDDVTKHADGSWLLATNDPTLAVGSTVGVNFRPGHARVLERGASPQLQTEGLNLFGCEVLDCRYLGTTTELSVRSGDSIVQASLDGAIPDVGGLTRVDLHVPIEKLHVFTDSGD